jgi:(R,R)-butanediol dehydrogenase/meso-butanediol dehydrogenase/diacetyl reductase
MRAVAITDDRKVAVVDIDHPVPGVGEVLLDVRYCGICGSDLHMLDMPAEMIPSGLVLGHEFTGVIADMGPGTEGWQAASLWQRRSSPHPRRGPSLGRPPRRRARRGRLQQSARH